MEKNIFLIFLIFLFQIKSQEIEVKNDIFEITEINFENFI